MKKLISVIPLMFLLAASCNQQTVVQQNTQVQTTTPSSASTIQNSNEVKMTGTIKAINNELPFDGALSISVDGLWIVADEGGLRPETFEPTRGNIIGIDLNQNLNIYVGKKAEVYCAKIPDNEKQNCSIVGNVKYYLKIIN